MKAPARPSLLERYGLAPAAIEALSLQRVAAAVPGGFGWSPEEQVVAHRMVYACGDPAIAPLLRFHRDPVAAVTAVLAGGASIITDVRMVATAVDRSCTVGLGCEVRCVLDFLQAGGATAAGITRTAAGMQTAAARLPGAVVVVGNAPTALLALLDLLDAGVAPPTLVIGTPVGFVAAAESKAALLDRAVPAITIVGTRGGSAMAAAALNALLRLAAGRR